MNVSGKIDRKNGRYMISLSVVDEDKNSVTSIAGCGGTLELAWLDLGVWAVQRITDPVVIESRKQAMGGAQ
jgi:hypothetical protein